MNAQGLSTNPSSQEDLQELKFYDYFLVLRKRWLLITIVFILFAVGGFFYTSIQPRIYKATALIAVHPPKSQQIGEIKVDQAYTRSLHYLNTQISVLSSRPLAKKVLARLMEKDTQIFFNKKRESVAPGRLLRHISITQKKKTNVLNISCAGKTPEQCAKIANLYVQVFIEENNRQTGSQRGHSLGWLQKKLPLIEREMLKAERKLREFEKENLDLLFISKKNKSYSDGIDLLVQELRKIEIDLITKKIRYQKCDNALKDGSVEAILALDFFSENAFVAKLRQQRFDLETERNKALLKLTERHPTILWYKKTLKEIDYQIRQETSKFVNREQQNYHDLIKKRKSIQQMLDLQKKKSVDIKQRYLLYERFLRDYESHKKDYNNFLDEVKDLRATSNFQTNNIQDIEPALPPRAPYKPNKLQNYFLSCIFGLSVGVLLAFFLENISDTVKNIKEIREIINVPTLGVVPYMSPKLFSLDRTFVAKEKDKTTVAESFRGICTALFVGKSGEKHCFVLTSPLANDGKTTILTNIGLALAQIGKKVLLVDGDLRKPQLKKRFELKDGPGFSDLLLENINVSECVQEISKNLWCMTAGEKTDDPYSCIHNENLEHVLTQVSKEYDCVFIDSPPIGVTSDALLISKNCEALILVVGVERCKKGLLQRLAHSFHEMSIVVRGIIVNDKDGKAISQSGYYGYNYGYYSYTDYK